MMQFQKLLKILFCLKLEIANTANNNWLEIPIKDVIDTVLEYFDGLIKVIN